MRQTINLNWIRSFEAAARNASFTEAARELGMTQAGVSQHVRLLEQSLGEPLFTRLPRRLSITDAGEAYLHVVRDCLTRLRVSTSEIFGAGDADGLVTVRCNMGLATHWLSGRLSGFLDNHPGVSLRLLAVVHGADAVWEGVDMELRYDSDHDEGFDAHPFRPDTLFPVCSPALAEGLIDPRDLLSRRLLHVIGNRWGWSDWFAAAGVEFTGELPVNVQVDTSAISLALAEHGVGFAIGHSSLVADRLADGRLVRPFPEGLAASEIFHLIVPNDRPLSPVATAFSAWLLKQ